MRRFFYPLFKPWKLYGKCFGHLSHGSKKTCKTYVNSPDVSKSMVQFSGSHGHLLFFNLEFSQLSFGKISASAALAMAMVATASTGRRRSWRTTDLVTSQVSMQSVQSTQSASGQGESFFISGSTISTRVSPIFFRVVSLDYGKPRISRFNFFWLITKKCYVHGIYFVQIQKASIFHEPPKP